VVLLAAAAGTAGVEAGRASSFWPRRDEQFTVASGEAVRGASTRGTLASVALSMVLTLVESRRSSRTAVAMFWDLQQHQ